MELLYPNMKVRLRYATTIDRAIRTGGETLPNINLTQLLIAFHFDKDEIYRGIDNRHIF